MLHRVTFVAFVASDIPIDDRARVPAAGLRHRLLRLEFGFRFAPVLKTKDRIGFVSFFGLGFVPGALGPGSRVARPGKYSDFKDQGEAPPDVSVAWGRWGFD